MSKSVKVSVPFFSRFRSEVGRTQRTFLVREASRRKRNFGSENLVASQSECRGTESG